VTPFGVPWDDLDAPALIRFLDAVGQDGEGITWEAKGDDVQGAIRAATVEDAVAGMANGFYVGYIVVGAVWDKGAGRWRLTGLKHPKGDELATWIDQVIDGVTPRPPVEIKPLACNEGPGAVIRVQPLAVPPAITSSGRLLIRTAKRTVPVTDPGDVRRLFERGERMLERARTEATNGANWSRSMPFDSRFSPSVTIGLAATGQARDIDRAVFRQGFLDWLREEFVGWDRRVVRRDLESHMWTDRVAFWNRADHGSQIGVTTAGAVFLSYWAGADRDLGLRWAIDGKLDDMWTLAGRITARLGGHGPTFAYGQINHEGGALANLRWKAERPEPAKSEIEAAVRHLKRFRGDPAIFEPEDSSGSGETW